MNLIKTTTRNVHLKIHAPDPADTMRTRCGISAAQWQSDLAQPNCNRCTKSALKVTPRTCLRYDN